MPVRSPRQAASPSNSPRSRRRSGGGGEEGTADGSSPRGAGGGGPGETWWRGNWRRPSGSGGYPSPPSHSPLHRPSGGPPPHRHDGEVLSGRASMNELTKLTAKDFATDQEVRW